MRRIIRVGATSPDHRRPPPMTSGSFLDNSRRDGSNSSWSGYSIAEDVVMVAPPHEIGTSTWSRDVHSDCSALKIVANGSRSRTTSSDRSSSTDFDNTKNSRRKDIRANAGSVDNPKRGSSDRFPAVTSTKRDDAETPSQDQKYPSGAVIRRYREPAVLGERPPADSAGSSGRRVVLARQHWVHEIQHDGHRPSLPKRAERGAPNRWRRYAPIALIHERGGWVNGGAVDGHSGRKDDYRYIQPGTPAPQPPPIDPVFSMSTDADHEGCAPAFVLPPECRDSTSGAYAAAVQLSTHVERMWHDFQSAQPPPTLRRSRHEELSVESTPQSSHTNTTLNNVVKAVRDAPRRIFDVLSSPLRSRPPTPSQATSRGRVNHSSWKERPPSGEKPHRRNRRSSGPSWMNETSPSNTSPSFC